MSILTNPYVYGLIVATATAILVYAYQHTIDPSDETNKRQTFYKTLGAGAISAVALAYFIYRPEPVSTEPFLSDSAMTTTAPTAKVA